MAQVWQKWRWDGLGLSIAGLCLLHCLITTILLAILASAGGALLNPMIHEVGLGLAILLGVVALGKASARMACSCPPLSARLASA